jgi:hypothetical protein
VCPSGGDGLCATCVGATGEVNKFADKLSSLNNYFEDWPTDEQAASDTDVDDDDDNE